ncbi:MAG: DUF87 domain-containing protein, partial [archaeon]
MTKDNLEEVNTENFEEKTNSNNDNSNSNNTSDKKKSKQITPKLQFLEDLEDSSKVYIGRKRSVLKQYGATSSALIGKIAEIDLQDKLVYLDGLNPHVVFIDGSRGSGKSYVLGVIAEELSKNNAFIGQIVVDPVGVFWSMKFKNQDSKELKLLEEWGLEAEGLSNLKVFIPEGMASKVSKDTYDETFSMYPSLLTAEDWCLTFGIERFSPGGLLLEKAISFVKSGYLAEKALEKDSNNLDTKDKEEKEIIKISGKDTHFTLDDLIECLQKSSEFNSPKKGYKPDSIRALVSRFEAAKSWGIFSNSGTPLSKLSREKQLTILDTSFLDDNITALVIGILARRLLSARKLSTRQEAVKKFETEGNQDADELLELQIPPTWLYIDEAHTLIPSGNLQTPATNALIEYVKQGRRPGCSLVFATQQPSAINTKVLSQVDILMSHKLVFNDDILAIQKRMPAIIPDAYKAPNFIKTLPVGTALVGDRTEETSRAFILKIRPRASQHEGRDAETIKEATKLSEKELINIAVEMIIKKINNDNFIYKKQAIDITDLINAKYNSNILWQDVLARLLIKGIIEKEDKLIRKDKIKSKNIVQETKQMISAFEKENGIEQEDLDINENQDKDYDDSNEDKDYDSDSTEDEGQENLEEAEEDLDDSIEKEKDERPVASQGIVTVEIIPAKISRERAENLAKSYYKKQFGILSKVEIDDSKISYRPIAQINYKVFDSNNKFKKQECFIDLVFNEFVHIIDDELIRSKGFSKINDLDDLDLEILYLLSKRQTSTLLAKTLGLSDSEIKRKLKNLVTKRIISEYKDKFESYELSSNFDLPFDATDKLISSIADIPLRKK